MQLYKDLILFIIGLLVIIKSADLLTSGAEGISRALRIPRIIIGLTIVSLGTTAPELSVSAFSSYMGHTGIAVGNALGSCLANIGLILGIAAIIRPIEFIPKFIKEELLFLLASTAVLYLLISDGRLGLVDGLFLLCLLTAFFAYIFSREMKTKKQNKQEPVSAGDSGINKSALMFLAGLLGVTLSARYAIIPSAVNFARLLNIPEILIGLTLVAIGTSLPELFTALVASLKKMGDLAVGNIIGANILNILWVLGFSSIINPLSVDLATKRITGPMVFFITLLLLIFTRTRFRLTRKEGLFLLLIYIGYIFYIFKFAYN